MLFSDFAAVDMESDSFILAKILKVDNPAKLRGFDYCRVLAKFAVLVTK